MKFSKSILAIAALFAVSTFTTVKPSSYLARAKQAAKDAAAKAQEAYARAQKAYTDLGGTEGVKGMATQVQGYYKTGQKYFDKAKGYMGTPSASSQAAEEANMEEMNAYAREQGLGS